MFRHCFWISFNHVEVSICIVINWIKPHSLGFICQEPSINKLKKLLLLLLPVLLPLFLQFSLSITTFNLRINQRQVNQSPTCCRDFEGFYENKQQTCWLSLELVNTLRSKLEPHYVGNESLINYARKLKKRVCPFKK